MTAFEPPPRSIAFVLNVDVIGGAEVHTLHLAEALRTQGVACGVVFLKGGEGLLGPRFRAAAIPVSYLGYPRLLRAFAEPQRLLTVLREWRSDVCVLPATSLLALRLGAGRVVARLVAMEHGDALNLSSLPWYWRMYDRFSRRLGASSLDGEIAVSDVAARALATLPHARRVKVIYNGVDLRSFRPREATTGQYEKRSSSVVALGAVSRLVKGKGIDVLIEAVAQLAKTRSHLAWELRIAGDGPERGALEAQSKRLGLSAHVTFLGPVHDIAGFWSRVDIGVFPADRWTESFGLAAMEALACGRPVVVADSNSYREVLRDCPGAIFVRRGAVDSLVAAIFGAALSVREQAYEPQMLHEWVAHRYSMDVVAQRYLSFFSEL